MAGSSLLVLLDDIAAVLDDVALMTKVAAKKTAGVLGDDLALNAEQVSGVRAEREIPVVWAVAKGSIRNKLILVPTALGISAVAPWLITPLLMLGGCYLCFEGFEKLAHKFLHSSEEHADKEALLAAAHNVEVDLVAYEKDKIQGAIRTDFVLSAEIIVIALGTVAGVSIASQLAVLSLIAAVMTVGVYGLVAGIVKLDDAGLYLCKKTGQGLWLQVQHKVGRLCLVGAPYLMKTLTVVGTIAMFMVGGGILTHGFAPAHDLIHHIALAVREIASIGPLLFAVLPILLDAVVGVIAGAILLVLSMVVAGIVKLIRPQQV
jgi:predicted DNA repair protein MutK